MVVTKTTGKGNANDSTKLVEVLFEEFVQAGDSVDILLTFHKLKAAIGAENIDNGRELYTLLKSKLQSWKCKSLWDVLDARAKHKEYGNGKVCEDLQVLVIGSGPIGLRTAIEVAFLGAKVIVVEKRTSFSRNNVLHLWPFLIPDFRSLGAKKFYGKFCSGSLDHIGIRMLQCLLMKAALILGVQIYTGVTFEKVIEPTSDCGWRCQIDPPFHPASQFDLDMIVGADGKKNVLPGFPQIEMRGSLAIGITLNLVYHGTKQEAAIPEVSGLAYHFKPQFFDELYQKSGVRLENFVYYKGETHYFVMTAVKSSLLARGALIMDYPKPADLLAPQNVNHERLIEYALDAVKFGTEGKLTDIEFVKNDRGKSDIAVFDFTSLKKAEHAAKIVERKGHRLLMALVGDSLIEPFWPTGSGCARGVLSALDTAWMLRSFAMDRPPLQVLSERENIYKLLSATSVDNLRKNYDAYTINPFTRYVNLNLKRVKEVYHLYDADDPVNADFRVGSPTGVSSLLENTKRRLSVSSRNAVKPGKNRRKSSSDDLDEKRGRNRTRKSSSDDLDEKKVPKSRRKSIKQVLRRGHSRDTDNELNDVTPNSKSKKSVKKMRSQSSESADEKEVRARRLKKLGRTKSRDTDGSNNSLDAIAESPKTAAKNERVAENKDNSLLMKQRSTKRWRLFGGAKQKPRSVDKDTKANVHEKENMVAKKDEQENAKKLKKNAESEKKEGLKNGNLRNQLTEQQGAAKSVPGSQVAETAVPETEANERPKNGPARMLSKDKAASTDPKGTAGLPPISETYTKSTLRQLNSQESASPRLLRNSLRKPSELRAGKDAGFTRSIGSGAATLPRATPAESGPVKRTNSDILRNDRSLSGLRRAREKGLEAKVDVVQNDVIKKGNASEATGAKNEIKRAKLDIKSGRESLFDDVESLSPAAQRTTPLLEKLTPGKKDGKYEDGGAVTAAAGLAAMLALTTSLAMEGKQSLRGFQLERQKILTSSQVNVREKVALLNSVSNSNKKTRRDLTSALDSVDGGPKPVKRFFSFSTAQRNVKPKLDEDSHKSLTMPRKAFARQSLQEKIFSSHSDISSALDSAIDILIKSYSFNELQGTLKIMLNIFRCISKDPDDETPRRIWTDGQLFRSLVWSMNEAKLFLVVSGWMEIGSFIVFPKTKTVHEPIRVLMQNYRQLWEKHHLDTSCPHFVPSESSVKYRRRPSDVFQEQATNPEYARHDRKDTGSHSGSDSGMGFSETASEHNVPAVMSLKPADDADVFTEDVRGPAGKPGQLSEMTSQGVNGAKRSSQVLDPRVYLETSYNQNEHDVKLNPVDYLNQSAVIPQQPTSSTSIPENPLVYPSEPTSSKDHPSKSLKKHYWEILEEPTPTPQSPQGILYAPSHQATVDQADKKRSSFRDSRQLASQLDVMIETMDEPMEYDPNVPPQDPRVQRYSSHDDINSDLSDSEVFTKEVSHDAKTSNKQRTNSKRKDELNDLFETLDLVSEALEPLQVVYEEKPKKNRRAAKSNEASRRREEYTRTKLQAASAEEQALRTRRKTRSQTAREKQIAGGKSVDNNVQQATERDRGKKTVSRKQDVIREVDEKVSGSTPRSRRRQYQTAVQSSTETLRRSQRIAESSAKSRKAVLVLDTSGYPEESSTDLNQAFVNSTLNESKHESSLLQNGSIDGEKTSGYTAGQKKKVRRQSSIVKSNKSRVRSKRNGYKSRKDRSIDT